MGCFKSGFYICFDNGSSWLLQERAFHKLSFWGLLQKIAYIPIVFVLIAAAIVMMYFIGIAGYLVILIATAVYMIKSVNLMCQNGYVTNIVRVCLVIGSLLQILDILCAVIIYIIAKQHKNEEPVIVPEVDLEKIEEN